MTDDSAGIVKRLRDWKSIRMTPEKMAHFIAAAQTAADLIERLSASLAESERKCERLKFHAGVMAKEAEDYIGIGWDYGDESGDLKSAITAYRAEFKEE